MIPSDVFRQLFETLVRDEYAKPNARLHPNTLPPLRDVLTTEEWLLRVRDPESPIMASLADAAAHASSEPTFRLIDVLREHKLHDYRLRAVPSPPSTQEAEEFPDKANETRRIRALADLVVDGQTTLAMLVAKYIASQHELLPRLRKNMRLADPEEIRIIWDTLDILSVSTDEPMPPLQASLQAAFRNDDDETIASLCKAVRDQFHIDDPVTLLKSLESVIVTFDSLTEECAKQAIADAAGGVTDHVAAMSLDGVIPKPHVLLDAPVADGDMSRAREEPVATQEDETPAKKVKKKAPAKKESPAVTPAATPAATPIASDPPDDGAARREAEKKKEAEREAARESAREAERKREADRARAAELEREREAEAEKAREREADAERARAATEAERIRRLAAEGEAQKRHREGVPLHTQSAATSDDTRRRDETVRMFHEILARDAAQYSPARAQAAPRAKPLIGIIPRRAEEQDDDDDWERRLVQAFSKSGK